MSVHQWHLCIAAIKKKPSSKTCVLNAEIFFLSFSCFLGFWRDQNSGSIARQLHAELVRNLGSTSRIPEAGRCLNPDLSFKGWLLTHNPICLSPTSFLFQMKGSTEDKKVLGCHQILPEASCRVEGAFDWPLLPCRYVYLSHN